MYFFKNLKKSRELFYKMERKKCLSGVTLKLKKNQEKSGKSEKSCEIYKIWLSKIN